MTAYNIASYSDLKTIASDLAGTYTITANIDASESEEENYSGGIYLGFPPIGASGTEFIGTLDGGGFTISNLYINRTATTYVGLFGKVTLSGGFIKDVILKDFNISGGAISGLLAGNVTGGASDFTISGVTADGTLVGAGSSVGGLCGSTSSVTMYNCYANCNITAASTTAFDIGGLIGSAINTDCTATCGATGSIVASGSVGGAGGIGGFVGKTSSTASNFTSCYSTVSIIDNTITSGAYYSSIGGFVGYNDSATITLCSALGPVLSTDTYVVYIGGFAGYSDGNITKCYATGSVDATDSASTTYIGGFIGFNSCTTMNNCYSHGDVGSIGIGAGTYVLGGFTANLGSGITIVRCYSTGYVNQLAGSVGGFSGSNTNNKSQVTCLWDTDTSGITTSAGPTPAVGKTTAELILQATTSAAPFEFDYDTVWQMSLAVTSAVEISNLTVWLSSNGDYEKFEAGTKDADSFQLTIPSTNEIRWVESLEALVVGTSGDEWKIASNKLGTPLSPTNFGVKKQSSHGSAYIQTVQINEVILFIDYVKRKIREMTYDPSSEKFTCPDMTALAEHITEGQIKWVAYQRNPDSILWVGLETGEVRSFVYDREQNVLAWSKIPIAGDGEVQSGCVIPGPTEDVIYLAVNRTIDGDILYYEGNTLTWEDEILIDAIGDRVYIEKFTPRLVSAIEDSFFVDCGKTYEYPGSLEIISGESLAWEDEDLYYESQILVDATWGTVTVTSTATGYDHLDGETVKVLADGVEIDDSDVYDGHIDLTLNGVSVSATKIQAGLPYTSLVQPMRIIMGDSMGMNTRVNPLVISFVNTGAAKYGKTEDELFDIDFTDPRWTNTCDIEGLFTGEVVVETVGGFDSLNPVFIVSDSPLPCTVRAIIVDIDRTS